MQKVYWLLDEVLAQISPFNWNEASNLASELVALIGNPYLEHTVVNPIDSFRKLVYKLLDIPDLHVSTLIDISGWIGYGLKPLFPQAELVADFSLSRIIDVSTTDFRRVGYLMNKPQEKVREKASELDLSQVFIIDDTSFTGRTNALVMNVFGIAPRNTSHLLLLANKGKLSKSSSESTNSGAVGLLEESGSRVLYGDFLETPNDDAEHLRDLFQHPSIKTGFSSAVELHYQVKGSDRYRERLGLFLTSDGSIKDLFPQRVESIDLDRLTAEGRFIRNPTYTPLESSIYSTNPLLWTFNDFWRKIDEPSLFRERNKVLSILERFHSLSADREGVTGARKMLAKEAQNILQTKTIEGKSITRERG